MRWAFMGIPTAIFMWSQVAIADELPDCKKIRNAGKKIECLQNSIAILQKQATGNVVQMGSKAFGQNQSDSPNWSPQDLPHAGPTSWTSPPISFAQQFATTPAVSVAIAGIEFWRQSRYRSVWIFGGSYGYQRNRLQGHHSQVLRGLVWCYGELARIRPQETMTEHSPHRPRLAMARQEVPRRAHR